MTCKQKGSVHRTKRQGLHEGHRETVTMTSSVNRLHGY